MRRRTFLRSAAALAAASTLTRPSFGSLYRPAGQDPADLVAVRGDGGKVTLRGPALRELRNAVKGRLLLAKSEGYDDARRVLNASIDRHPALIAQPASVAEIQAAVRFAAESSLLLAVKCGGHSFSGMSTCDGGMMIDLSRFRGVTVDPQARRARVLGGSLLGMVDRETAPHGLVTPLGTVSHTGVGGLTTGGGFGRVARRFGLALDNVTAVEVVTADGTVRQASATENPDLYWGVRGGGGNFGIVTSFDFRLHPMQQRVLAGEIMFPVARATELLRLYFDYPAPDELYLDFMLQRPPRGADGAVGFALCYSGPERDADRVLAPIRKLGTPLRDTVAPANYVDVQRSGDSTDPRAFGMYVKSGFTVGFPSGLIDAIVAGFEGDPGRMTSIFSQHSGGAISRVAADATAFAHRDATHNLLVLVGWPAATDGAPHMDWARRYWKTLEPFTSGFYTNEVADESAEVLNENYRGNYPRLVQLKRKYDPANLFRLNANVKPG